MNNHNTKTRSIYMDRHDVSDVVTAEHVAQLHKEDLKIEHKFDCKGLTYWFDEKRKTAFCLVEAPNEQAVRDMHNSAHGEIPHSIIEVDSKLVESFLGRIEDPPEIQPGELNIINDPAFRIIMSIGFEMISLLRNDDYQNVVETTTKTVNEFNGRIVKQYKDEFLVSFDSVSKALLCSIEIQSGVKSITKNLENINLTIGLSSGLPVTEKETFFEDAIKLVERMCIIAKSEIIVSSEVKELYMSENLNSFFEDLEMHILSPTDENFLNRLMENIEEIWRNNDQRVDSFSKQLGYSKSQLYRKMVALTNKSPNNFLRDYRLKKALELLNKRKGNISEIAFETGFNSLSYFSKCFQKRYNLLPSEYLSSNTF